MTAAATVLVTGSTGAIGAAVVDRLLADGWRVAGVDARPAPGGDRPGLRAVTADITTEDGRASALAAARDLGALAGLVNCAGVVPTGPALAASDAEWERAWRINVMAAYSLSCAVADDLTAAGHGVIVNIGSIAGARPSPNNIVYAATKAALASVTATLAVVLADRGIRVNAVAPGLIDTPLSDRTDEVLATLSGRDPETVARGRTAAVPLGRRGTPSEVADAVAFLLSNRSSYISGQTLHVNGGAHATT
ncbi:SDR family NAD(P)-dependent oxidoreductase [Dactylosporangium sp. CA-092794]|uniref:SDR family NAD(P)-dependent oxidoreductase n=1 Tax=Dactylosporangium sp. CA-092794 TaxID=3239929 RepID=UPI003D8BBA88